MRPGWTTNTRVSEVDLTVSSCGRIGKDKEPLEPGRRLTDNGSNTTDVDASDIVFPGHLEAP